jgi:hypothetical protein
VDTYVIKDFIAQKVPVLDQEHNIEKDLYAPAEYTVDANQRGW